MHGQNEINPRSQNSGFTLIEMMIVTVIISILAAISVVGFGRVRLKAHVASVQADARILYNGFQEFHAIRYEYPNASSPPNFNLVTFEPMVSMGFYQGSMRDRLLNNQADGYDSPDDSGPNQEFWVQFTLKIDPSYQVIVASSDNTPLGGNAWLEGVYVFQDGNLISGPGT